MLAPEKSPKAPERSSIHQTSLARSGRFTVSFARCPIADAFRQDTSPNEGSPGKSLLELA